MAIPAGIPTAFVIKSPARPPTDLTPCLFPEKCSLPLAQPQTHVAGLTIQRRNHEDAAMLPPFFVLLSLLLGSGIRPYLRFG
jgi:hypothetical protein